MTRNGAITNNTIRFTKATDLVMNCIPEQISDLGGIIAIATGGNHSLTVKSDGTVWAWGNNGSGQLGDGTTSTQNTPVQVSGISEGTVIAAGGSCSFALKSDGTVWAWGYNGSGQLGDGTETDSSIPVQVSNLSEIIAVAAGGWHSLALKSDGTVWAWGHNGDGQLGDGTKRDISTPIQVSNLSEAIAIDADSGHSLALKSDGTVWEWGMYNLNSEGTYFVDIETNNQFHDPYRGCIVELLEKTGSDSDSKAKLKVTLSGVDMDPEGALNFGTVNSTSSRQVVITNNTSDLVTIGSVTVSGRDTDQFHIITDSCSNMNLQPGESCSTTISFSPDSEGDKFADLIVSNSDSTRPQAAISLYGDGSLSPSVITGTATNVTSSSATLNGTVNGLDTTVWFEYSTKSGLYSRTSSTQSVSVSSDTAVSIGISDLSAGTTYYYRLAALNTYGVTYGNENSFATLCRATILDANPDPLKLKRDDMAYETVTVACKDGTGLANATVTAKVTTGKKCISVSPSSGVTDASGQAVFTITAKKTGNARVRFEVNDLRYTVAVKVKNK